ncbi:MAG: transporter substrate-binding domain-containing protein [Thermodesulfobacteriota bacterium]
MTPSAIQPSRKAPSSRIKSLCFPFALLLSLLLICSAFAADSGSRRIYARGDNNYPPYEFINAAGQPDGYNVDLFRAIADAMGLQYDLHLGPWDNVRHELETGKIDVLIGMFNSPERDRRVDFSLPHLVISNAIFVRKGSPIRSEKDLKGKRIIVQHGDIMDDYVKERDLANQVLRVESQPEALRLLSSGKYDCFLGVKLQGLYTIHKYGLSNVVSVGPPLEPRPYGFAVTEGNTALLAKLNEGLNIVKQTGRFDEIYEKWFGILKTEGPTVSEIAAYAAVVLIPLLFVLIGSLLWSRSLKVKIARKTEELRRELEERKRAEESLRESEQRFRAIADYTYDWESWFGPDARLLWINPAVEWMTGYSRQECMDMEGFPMPLVHPEDRDAIDRILHGGRQGLQGNDMPFRVVKKDGSCFWAAISWQPIFNPEGEGIGCRTSVRDISESRKAQEALRESEEQLRTLINAVPDIVYFKDGQGRWLQANEFYLHLLHLENTEYRGKKDSDLAGLSPLFSDAFLVAEDTDERAWEAGTLYRGEETIPRPGGPDHVFDIIKVPMLHPDGTRKGLVVVGRDITDRKRAEAKLEEAYDIIRKSPVVAFLWKNAEGWPVELVTENVEALFGYSPQELLSGAVPFSRTLHPDDLPRVADEVASYSKEEGRVSFDHQPYRIVTKAGKIRWVNDSTIIRRNTKGEITHYQGILFDITERIQAQEESERLQSQLLQTQKLEAIGRLAGGVAHDFNNMINIIIGYADIALLDLSPGDPLRETLDEIRQAANRSAELTKQLLGFARRQTISPLILNVTEVIGVCEKMLRRLVGEEIELRFTAEKHLWPVEMDPSQMDQILTNLAANARDAIQGTGEITIEASNATLDEAYCAEHLGCIPGDYVKISFSDSGVGMDRETRERIFEPFFTTKNEREGTGLGLATVYGIIQQNRGFINVYSEPGQGTAFNIYLPRFHGKKEGPAPAKGPEQSLVGTETILVVEDEGQILKLCKMTLERQGYKVLSAQTPGEALLLCEKHIAEIDLLLTDVIMPGMNGNELKERITSLRPEIKTIFMSGYTADTISHRGVLAQGTNFLQKPFSPRELAQRVRQVLG